MAFNTNPFYTSDPTTPADSSRPSRHVHATVPAELHDALRHLSVDLSVPIYDLVVDGILLLLRYHDRGKGLPEPKAPFSSTTKEASR